MKRTLLIFIFLFAVSTANIFSFAETKTAMATGGLSVPEIFSLEFYTDDPEKILYSTDIPFTNMDPTKTFVQADGRASDDGKSDIGLLCKTNLGDAWYLRIQGSDSPLITVGNINYGMWQPWNRTLNTYSDGEVVGGKGWHPIPTTSTSIYEAGLLEYNNLLYGTLCTLSFAINPSQLDPTQIYQCNIQFTLTTTP